METETRTPARLLEGALNAAGIDGRAGEPDYVLLDRLLQTHQGRRLLDLANLGAASLEDAATYAAEQPEADMAHEDGSDCYGQCAEPVPPSILEEAQGLVYGDRQGDYGHPRQDFTRTALLWTGVLMHKLAEGEHITPEDVALCMVQVKISREVNKPKRDNRVDGAGYLLCLDRLETGR